MGGCRRGGRVGGREKKRDDEDEEGVWVGGGGGGGGGGGVRGRGGGRGSVNYLFFSSLPGITTPTYLLLSSPAHVFCSRVFKATLFVDDRGFCSAKKEIINLTTSYVDCTKISRAIICP